MTSLLRARAPSRFNFYKTKNIMALEIEGRIKQKLAKQSGQGAKGSWTKQDFVLEYQDGNYPADVCLTAFGNDKVADLDKYQVGDSVKVAFNLRAREYNGRWYNDVRVWRIGISPSAAAGIPGSTELLSGSSAELRSAASSRSSPDHRRSPCRRPKQRSSVLSQNGRSLPFLPLVTS